MEINTIEKRKTVEKKSTKPNFVIWKDQQNEKPLFRLTQKRNTQITNISNETGCITIDLIDVRWIIKEH